MLSKGKKAQISEGMTWLAATFFVLLAMVFFTLLVVMIFSQTDKKIVDTSLKPSISSFFVQNRAVISLWSDDECIWTGTYFEETEKCKQIDVQKKYEDLCNVLMNYFNNPEVYYKHFCIETRTDDKNEVISIMIGDKTCGLKPNGETCISSDMLNVYDSNYFISKGGKPIITFFYDGKTK
jgi:hypothetical protein